MFFPARLLIQKLYLASDEAFQKAPCIAPRHDICRGFKFGQLLAVVTSESFADSSRTGIVERYVLCAPQTLLFIGLWCAQSSMHLARSAAPSGGSRLQSSTNFGNIN